MRVFVIFHVCSRGGNGGNYNQAGTTAESLSNETNLKKKKSQDRKRYVVANFCQKKFKSKILHWLGYCKNEDCKTRSKHLLLWETNFFVYDSALFYLEEM